MSERVCNWLKWYKKDGKQYIIIDEAELPDDRQLHTGYAMDTFLKKSLDSICYNIHKDMDFVILITGHGDVRVGKSVLALQIAYYIASKIGATFNHDFIIYTAEELMKTSIQYHKHVFIYDEAREGLNTGMALANIQKRLLQFFAEAGQNNNVYILVMPDFFELNKKMAMNRSEFLLDCFFQLKETKDKEGNQVTEKVRGFFKFYKKEHKKMLYLRGKQDCNYKAWRSSFSGIWNNIYPIDEQKYRDKKQEALKNTATTEKARRTHNERHLKSLYAGIMKLKQEGKTWKQIGEYFDKGQHWAQKLVEKHDFESENAT